ncbi:hypothetical protein [Methylobacter sp.]
MNLVRLIALLFAGVSCATLYLTLALFVGLIWLLSTAMIVIESVADFVDYHLADQWDVVMDMLEGVMDGE